MPENDSSIGRVSVDIGANLDDLRAGFAEARKRIGDLGKSVETAGGSFDTLSKGVGESMTQIGGAVSRAGATITKTVGAASASLIGLGTLATKTAIEFESSFAGVRKTVDATDEEFAQLERGFRDIAKQAPISANALNKIGETAGALGIQKESILSFTKTVAEMSVTTNLSSEEAANAFARIGSIMGVTADGFNRLGSTIVDLGNKGSSTESEIVNMGLRIAGAAKAAGLSAPQMLGLSAALANVGIRAEAGGTAMSTLIIQIAGAVATGGEKLDQFARVAGVSSEAFAKAFKENGAQAIGLFVQGLNNIQQTGGNVFATLDEMGIKEIRLRDSILRSVGAAGQFTETLKTSEQAWAANTALTAEAEKRYATVASQIEVMKNKIYDSQLTLGQAFLPIVVQVIGALEPMIQGLASAANAFAALDPSTQKVIAGIVAFGLAIGPALLAVGGIITALGALAPAFTAIGSALAGIPALLTAVGTGFTALAAVLAANPWIAIATGIAAAAVAIAMNWDKIKSTATAAWESTKTIVLGAARQIYQGIIEWLVTKASAIATRVQGVAESFAKPFEWLADHLVGHSVVPDMVEDIAYHMQNLDVAMTAPARAATNATAKVFEGMALTTQGAFNQVLSTINFSYGSAVQTVSQSLARMTSETVNWAQMGMQIGQQFLGNMINTFIQLLTQWLLTMTGMTAATQGAEAAKTAIFGTGEAARLGIHKATNAAIAATTVASLGGMVAVGNAAVAIMTATMMAASAMMAAIAGALAAGIVTAELAPPVAAASGALAVGAGTLGAGALGAIQAAAGAAIVAAAGAMAFAKGGIVTGPTLGMIGEAGSNEAVIPLNKQGAQFMADMLGMGGSNAGQQQIIELSIDGDTFRRWILRGMPGEVRLRAGAIA